MTRVLAQSAAVTASLAHVLLDFAIGLYGTSLVSALQVANIVVYALVYGAWSWTLASTGAAALTAQFVLALLWTLFAQGIAGFAACPPPCGGALGFQDLTHLASVLAGAWAAYATLGPSRRAGLRWDAAGAVAVLVAIGFALQGTTFLTYRPSP